MKKHIFIFTALVPVLALSNESISLNGDNVLYKNEKVEFNLYPKNSFRKVDLEDGEIASSYSPDKKHVLIYKTEEAYLYLENGDKKLVSKGYCELVNLTNGCVLITESHDSTGICDSQWKGNDKLESYYGVIELPNKSKILPPQHIIDDYEHTGAFDYSIQSYLACYPINTANHNDYQEISNKLISEWDRKEEGKYLLEKLNKK